MRDLTCFDAMRFTLSDSVKRTDADLLRLFPSIATVMNHGFCDVALVFQSTWEPFITTVDALLPYMDAIERAEAILRVGRVRLYGSKCFCRAQKHLNSIGCNSMILPSH
jgi:hypothetical protein